MVKAIALEGNRMAVCQSVPQKNNVWFPLSFVVDLANM
jgi:hypothetical protein